MKTLVRFMVVLLFVSLSLTACEDPYQSAVEEELVERKAAEGIQNETSVIEKKGCDTCK